MISYVYLSPQMSNDSSNVDGSEKSKDEARNIMNQVVPWIWGNTVDRPIKNSVQTAKLSKFVKAY